MFTLLAIIINAIILFYRDSGEKHYIYSVKLFYDSYSTAFGAVSWPSDEMKIIVDIRQIK